MGGVAKALDEAGCAVFLRDAQIAAVVGGAGFRGGRPAGDAGGATVRIDGERAAGLEQALGEAGRDLAGIAGDGVEQHDFIAIRAQQRGASPFAAARVQSIGQNIAAIAPLSVALGHQPDADRAVACLGIGQGRGGKHEPYGPAIGLFASRTRSGEFGGGAIGQLQRPHIPQVRARQDGSHLALPNHRYGVVRRKGDPGDMFAQPQGRRLIGCGA